MDPVDPEPDSDPDPDSDSDPDPQYCSENYTTNYVHIEFFRP
jgi:hypothetical protein